MCVSKRSIGRPLSLKPCDTHPIPAQWRLLGAVLWGSREVASRPPAFATLLSEKEAWLRLGIRIRNTGNRRKSSCRTGSLLLQRLEVAGSLGPGASSNSGITGITMQAGITSACDTLQGFEVSSGTGMKETLHTLLLVSSVASLSCCFVSGVSGFLHSRFMSVYSSVSVGLLRLWPVIYVFVVCLVAPSYSP